MENGTESLRAKALREKIHEQTTAKMLGRLRRAARSRMRMILGPGGHVCHADVEDLVSCVIMDTLDGRLTWDPDKESLEHNLLDAVRFRVRNRYEREPTQAHEPLEEDEIDRTIVDSVSGQVAMLVPPLPGNNERARRIRDACDDLVAWLRPRVHDKPELLRLFELFLEGITDRDEVMRDGEMDANAYRNARRCLDRLVERIPASLRAAAFEALDVPIADASGDLKLAS